jgi:hypothetical protein
MIAGIYFSSNNKMQSIFYISQNDLKNYFIFFFLSFILSDNHDELVYSDITLSAIFLTKFVILTSVFYVMLTDTLNLKGIV